MQKTFLTIMVVLLFVGSILTLSSTVLDSLTTTFTDLGFLGYLVYILVIVSSVVFAPMTGTPAILIASGIFGAFLTAILTVFGLMLGATIAFLLSRWYGRPFLEQYFDLQRIDALLCKIPDDSRFLFIVLLRLTLPVDFVSYALGLTKSLDFTRYIVATFIGIIWFSFAYAYMGEAFMQGNIILFASMFLLSVSVFVCAFYMLYKKSDKS